MIRHTAVILHEEDYEAAKAAIRSTKRWTTFNADPLFVRDETGDISERRGSGWVSWDLLPEEEIPSRLSTVARALDPEDAAVLLRIAECLAGDRRR